jgi:hypothetical protein
MQLPARNLPYFIKQLACLINTDATAGNRLLFASLFYGTAIGNLQVHPFSNIAITPSDSAFFFAGAAAGDTAWVLGLGAKCGFPELGYYVPPQAQFRLNIAGTAGPLDEIRAGSIIYQDILDDPMFPAPFESHRQPR